MELLSGQETTKPGSHDWDAAVANLRVSPEDRGRPMPLWALVAARLEALIESGRLPDGSRVENEVTFAERLGISRPTMRRALQELVNKGFLVRRAGVGTQVVSPSVRRPAELTSLFDDLAKSGRTPATRVLSFETVPASDALALSLRIPPRSLVTAIRRLRLANAEPLALMTNYIPAGVAKLYPDDLVGHGLYECIRNTGSALPSTATEVIGARVATTEECAVLGIQDGAAVLTVTRTAWSRDGLGVEFGSHIYRADRYAFEREVTER